MKIVAAILVSLCVSTFWANAQTTASSSTVSNASTNQIGYLDTPYAVVDRGANQRVWQKITYEMRPDGKQVPHVHRYVELATGLNFRDPTTGQWVDSKEQVDILPNGTAAATHGQHRVYFPGDIAEGAIELITPDGKQLLSRPIGLSYDDGSNTVLIAILTNSVGQLAGSNQVIYPDAFEGASASLRYTYTKAGFEQDILVQDQIPTPESLGLNPGTARLEVLTEFFDTNNPVETVTPINSQDGLSDITLAFGKTKMGRGRAFSIGNANQANSPTHGTRTYKNWLQLTGRKFLIEEVPYQRIAPQLEQLPTSVSAFIANSNTVSARSILYKVSAHRLLPPLQIVKTSTKGVQLAKTDFSWKRGVVLDYVAINSDATNFVFQGDLTYYVSGVCNLSGTTTIEGDTVIKMDGNGQIVIDPNGAVNCQTGPYRSAVFTSVNDNSVGEAFGSGTPVLGDVYLFLTTSATNVSLHDMRFSYCFGGIEQYSVPATLNLWNCQFVNLDEAVLGYNIGLHNVLIGRSDHYVSAIYLGGTNFVGENLTVDGGDSFMQVDGVGATVAMTNCLVTGLPLITGNSLTLFTNSTVWLTSSSSTMYQTVGAGSYYLADNSTCRNYGTTNINLTLLAQLRQKTTYPPMVYESALISGATNLSPIIPRDTNSNLDIGYHYDPLDYVFGGSEAQDNLTFTAGTVVGWFDTQNTAGNGIAIDGGVTIAFNGTATAPCWLTRYDTVQEGGNGNWTSGPGGFWGFALTGSSGDYSYSSDTPQVVAQFTKFSSRNFNDMVFRDYNGFLVARMSDCEFWNAGNGGYNISLNFTNCLFFRTPPGIESWNNDSSLTMKNCTVEGGNFNAMSITHDYGSIWPVLITDCAFDGTTINMDDPSGGNTNITFCDFNAFLINSNRLAINGPHDVTNLISFNWQTNRLGNYYSSTNSPLINAGSITADKVGLYHFTIVTNQVKETNSIVDIGYHYVSVDANGNPVDSNNDRSPDYLQDVNGNGLVDAGETNWSIAIVTQPVSQAVIQTSNVTFSVAAVGITPFGYQWSFNSSLVVNATNSVLTLTNVQTSDAGNYSVIVFNGSGSVTSSIAVLTVIIPPTIVQQPAIQAAFPGGNVNFSVTATGTTPLYYQWLFNGIILSRATNASLALSNVQVTNVGTYSVIITNVAGSVASSNVALSLLGPPLIVHQPTNQVMAQSSNVNFTVQATGTAPLYYQWLKNGLVLTNGSTISGANTNTLNLTGLKLWNNDLYSVMVSNSLGQVTSFYATRVMSQSFVVGWGNDTYGQSSGPSNLINVAAIAVPNNYSLVVDARGNVTGFGQMLSYEYASAILFGVSGYYYNGDAIAPGATLSRNNSIDGYILAATDSSGNNITSWPPFIPVPTLVSTVVGGPLGPSTQPCAIGRLGTSGNYTTYLWGNMITDNGQTQVTWSPTLLANGAVPGGTINFTNLYFHFISDGTYEQTTALSVNGVNTGVWPYIASPTFNLTLSEQFIGNVGDIVAVGNAFMSVSNISGNIITCVMLNNNAFGQGIPFISSAPMVPTLANIVVNISKPFSLSTVATYPMNDGAIPTPNANSNYPIGFSMAFPNFRIPAGKIMPSQSSSTIQAGTLVQVTNPDGSGVGGSGALLFVTQLGAPSNNIAAPNIPVGVSNVVAIAGSPDSGNYDDVVLALKSDGTVAEWDLTGLLAAPSNLTNVVAIAAGDQHCVALKGDGTVVAWGDNTFGQTNIPSNIKKVVAIAASTDYSLALQVDGSIVAWGYNIQTLLPHPAPANVVAIAAGYYHSLALKSDGTLVAWDAWSTHNPTVTQIPPNAANVVAIAAGNAYSMALKADGSLVVWGSNVGTGVPSWLTNVVAIEAGNNNSMAIMIPGPPQIIQQPSNYTANLGSSATFSVTATSIVPLSYQWLINGTNLIGATNAFLTLNGIQTNSAGPYSVIVSNKAGSVTSSNAVLNILLPPIITTQPTNYVTSIGSNASLSVIISSNSATPLRYQWLCNGTNLVGATNATLMLSSVQTNKAGVYFVVITNVVGSAVSVSAILTIIPPASWFQQYWGTNYQTNSNASPFADPDGDGLSNIGEYLAGANPTNFNQAILGQWRFNTTNWIGDQWQLPLSQFGLTSALVSGVETNAVDMTGSIYSKLLSYRYAEVSGNLNLTLKSGTVIFWFRPTWSGVNEGGSGPGSNGRLLNIGTWTTNAAIGLWMINLDTSGDWIGLDVQDNAGNEARIPYISIPGGMVSNQWVQIAVTYTPTNTALYVNGALAGTGGGFNNIVPPQNVLSNGFAIGTDVQGGQMSLSAFDLMQTFNYPLAAAAIQANFQSAFTSYLNADPDGDGIPNSAESALGLNPLVNDWAQGGLRLNYGYTLADWLNQVSGIRSGNISSDAEGNILSVSQ